MEVNKMEKKSEKKERKEVTRRQFLKDLGLFTVAGIALNKLDFLAGEIIKRTGGDVLPKDAHCEPINKYYELPCGYHCPFLFQCSNAVVCEQDFKCVHLSDIYGCTQRQFFCQSDFNCDVYNCTPWTHNCYVTFGCETNYKPCYSGYTCPQAYSG
jgi:hypothetical protein